MQIAKDELYASNEMIEDGSYFQESLAWYNDIFILSAAMRLLYAVFVVTCSYSLYLAVTFIISMFPLRVVKSIVLKTDRDAGTYITARHLNRYGSSASNVLMQTIMNYVINREEYKLNDRAVFEVVKQKEYFVLSTSNRNVYDEFLEYTRKSGSNMNKLIFNKKEVLIQILKFDFIERKISIMEEIYEHFVPVSPPASAQVDFVRLSDGKKTKWRAIIVYDFTFSHIDVKKPRTAIPFKVTDYSVRRLDR